MTEEGRKQAEGIFNLVEGGGWPPGSTHEGRKGRPPETWCKSCGGCTACQCECLCPCCRVPGATMGKGEFCIGCEPEVELELQRQHEADHGPGRM